jgi:Helicase conserved C-terminal domain
MEALPCRPAVRQPRLQRLPHWTILEGRYTLAVLFEYAGTLGLIDLDYIHPAGAREDFRNNWGSDDFDALSRYDGLRSIRLNALGAYVLGLTDTYQPVDSDTTDAPPLKVLPNLDIVATGDIAAADRLLLTAYAKQTADRVWTVSTTSLLSAIDSGRRLSEFTTFLTERTEHELAGALSTLIADVHRRAGRLADLGHARLIECADPATAALIARDRSLRPLCRPIGDKHLAVPLDQELKFRNALLKLGYVVPGQPMT